jgi:hypothetical protein
MLYVLYYWQWDGWLIKSSFITKDEQNQIQKTKQINSTRISESEFVSLDDLVVDGFLKVLEHSVEHSHVEAAEVDLGKNGALEEQDVPRFQGLKTTFQKLSNYPFFMSNKI